MSTHNYSLKWEISKSASTCIVTATRISFGELCPACGKQGDDASILSYSADNEFLAYIPTRGGVPVFRQGELKWMIGTSLILLRALQRGVDESKTHPLLLIGHLADHTEEWNMSSDESIFIAALEKYPSENLLTVKGR